MSNNALNKITRTSFTEHRLGDRITAFADGTASFVSINGVFAIDAGVTLQQGTAVSFVTADKKFVKYDTANSGASDGTETAFGILAEDIDVSTEEVQAAVVIEAYLHKDKLFHYVSGTETADLDAGAVTDLRGRVYPYAVHTNTVIKIG